MKKPSRCRVRPLKVWALPTEEVAIKEKAADCSMSVSAYLRELGLSYQPKSIFDADAVLELAKVNGDLGRLGGLLKMWLTNENRLTPEVTPEIREVLKEIQNAQALLYEKVKQV